MYSLKTITTDKYLWGGWAIILLSSLVFCVPLLTPVSPEQYLAFFAFHFGIVITYHFVLFLSKEERVEDNRIHYRLVKLVLLLISAYALNREMVVFAASPVWFSIVLVVLSTNYLSSILFQKMPAWLRYLSFFLYGMSFMVFGYLTVYLLPLYAISIPGLLVLGISLHTFVPLLFCIVTVYLATRLAQNHRRYWISFASGVLTVIIFCFGFVVVWNNKMHAINRQYITAMAEGEDKLPLWVQVAQGVEQDEITEKILKTNLIYKIPNWNDNIFWSMPSRNFGDQQQLHDPLVTLATVFSGKVLLSEQDRIKILESQYNARHLALERLWSGEHLRTEQVTTNVKVWPAMHLAYTEKMLTVYNHQSRQAWNNQGEGIYTFHLPEGAVVTSLSLWINGKEEKAILSSKEKATTAYRTIVGYERRDPSVVHWQEGNTVSVRVFPVLASDSRTFKIGVTAPLRREGIRLVYDNIWFDGPDARSAEETVKLEVVGDSKSLIQQALFTQGNERVTTRIGRYQPRWNVTFKDNGLKENSFSFNGYQYSIQPYKRQRVPANIEDVYLDVSQAWSAEDISQVWNLVENKRVWIYNGEMQQVNNENKKALFAALQKQSFSLFPFHLVAKPEQSIVVSKSGSYSPTISDLEESPFLKSLEEKMIHTQRIRLFQLGTDISPYIRSLKERRYFDFEIGEAALLEYLLLHNVFVQDVETDSEIIVHSADVVITKQPGETASTAPDHLMRLFAYNHILQQLGKKDSLTVDSTALVKEAQEAYVVSPVSSLVVLETQADYDRFDITDSANSLKNASLKNNGAVPEPDEWAIIILLGAAFLFFAHKNKLI
jgi:XrtN system VIT domain protein